MNTDSSPSPEETREQRLREIEARLKAATPGPWRTLTNRPRGPWADQDCVPMAPDGFPVLNRNWKEACLNAVFIANARADVEWLLADAHREPSRVPRLTADERFTIRRARELVSYLAAMRGKNGDGHQIAEALREMEASGCEPASPVSGDDSGARETAAMGGQQR